MLSDCDRSVLEEGEVPDDVRPQLDMIVQVLAVLDGVCPTARDHWSLVEAIPSLKKARVWVNSVGTDSETIP